MVARLRFGRPAGDKVAAGDPPALFADLADARRGLAWTAVDRRRDFRAVFLGGAAGRRVLYEILAWSRVFASTFVPGDAFATHWREGGRDVGLRILAVLDAGRAVPEGADSIVIQEASDAGNGTGIIKGAAAPNKHIRAAGLDFRVGDVLVTAGKRLTARDLSLIAAGGVLFGAAYGGTLVFEYGFNVENVGEVWNESEQDRVRPPRGGSSGS